ncbi:type 2 lantibiotic biosynthesis protein LanM [Enterococcus sp. PF1-24]|uniref:type 2 lanthipeptide synthetase LanM family protein n=1 Tax=unclassified Enterococcus TaxID=2608891 RepID=UPI0024752133|nr:MULTISPECIES: type 2 lanthipeptide synthetase LanM family protein [unclassified Enterococcus]MDH6363685.1 type 2 lantibiotic biosynthesis protein LanM [Enterococcus sp. PFB1-1]MDH6400641.1 type 2 lantibiotic biosynthesis protein LanM [Enterococcus sp. PF1-24]
MEQDIFFYWKSLFPECNTEELEMILQNFFDEEARKGIAEENLESNFEVDYGSEIAKFLLDKNIPYLSFFLPFLNSNQMRIDRIFSSKIIQFNEKYKVEFLINLCEFIWSLSYRVLILETNLLDEEFQEKRNDITLQEFAANEMKTNEKYLLDVYKLYQPLVKFIQLRINLFLSYFEEIIDHTSKDYCELTLAFNEGRALGNIINISLNHGDTHNGGKNVAIISFENGKKIVYKPHSLMIDEKFYGLISWINETIPLNIEKQREITIINKGFYGWSEYVNDLDCSSLGQIRKYYYRFGSLMALIHSLNGKDLHHENIIAEGEYPVFIDLETLFSSSSIVYRKEQKKDVHTHAAEIISDSIYGTGLVPRMIGNGNQFVDISALGADSKQESPFLSYKLENTKSKFKLERVDSSLEIEKNLPRMGQKIEYAKDFLEEIIAGFETMYKWIIDNRETFIKHIRKNFLNVPVRFLYRNTSVYTQLYRTSLHPDFFQDEFSRNIILKRIAIGSDIDQRNVVQAEYKDLLLGDVPYFTVNTDSKDLITSKGEIKNFFLESPLDNTIKKILGFSSIDMERQLEFLNISFFGKKYSPEKDFTFIKFDNDRSENAETIKLETCLNTAIDIGKYLMEKSICLKNESCYERTWISTILEKKNQVIHEIVPVGRDFYLGNSGISLFLGNLGKITKNKKMLAWAEDSINSVISEMKTVEDLEGNLIGGFNGLSGNLYSIYKMKKILEKEEYSDYIFKYMKCIEVNIDYDTNFDVISGVAGAINVFYSIYRDTKDTVLKKYILKVLRKCWEHLKKNAVIDLEKEEVYWKSSVGDISTGFAHGNAGICVAIAKIYYLTKKEECLVYINYALKYERNLYSDSAKNWYTSIAKDTLSYGWCNGSGGILLSRLLLKEFGYTDMEIDDEIEIAFHTTVEKGFGFNLTLCHGDLGLLEIIRKYSKYKNDTVLIQKCNNTFVNIFNDTLSNSKWKSLENRGTETLGIMTGLSGIGYTLLRESNVDMPNILISE